MSRRQPTLREQQHAEAALLARLIRLRAEPNEFNDPRPESAVAPVAAAQLSGNRSLRWLMVAVTIVAFVLLPLIACFAREPSKTRFHVKAYSGKSCVLCKQTRAKLGNGDHRVAVDWTEDLLPEFIRAKLAPGYQFPVLVWTRVDGNTCWPKSSAVYSLDQLAAMCEASGAVKKLDATNPPTDTAADHLHAVEADTLAGSVQGR